MLQTPIGRPGIPARRLPAVPDVPPSRPAVPDRRRPVSEHAPRSTGQPSSHPLPVAGSLRREAPQRGPTGRRGPRRRRAHRPAGGLSRTLALVLVPLLILLTWRCAAPRPDVPGPPAADSRPAGGLGSVLGARAALAGPDGSSGSGVLDSGTAAALPAPRPDAVLQAVVERTIDPRNGTAAVFVRHLRTGASAGLREDMLFPSASLAKVPILVEVYRQLATGVLRQDETILITAGSITDGAGVLQARVGERLRVSELLRLSVSVSDNVAARLLLQRAGGVEAVNRTMVNLGLSQTRLYADDRPNTTSAAEMASLLAWMATWTPTSPTGRPASSRASGGTAALPARPLPDALAALLALPQNQAWLAQGVPASVPVAHKSGQLPNVRHDAGIVYAPNNPYVVVVLTDDLAHQGDAEDTIMTLSRRVFEHFSRR